MRMLGGFGFETGLELPSDLDKDTLTAQSSLEATGGEQGRPCLQNVGNSITMNTIKMTIFVK